MADTTLALPPKFKNLWELQFSWLESVEYSSELDSAHQNTSKPTFSVLYMPPMSRKSWFCSRSWIINELSWILMSKNHVSPLFTRKTNSMWVIFSTKDEEVARIIHPKFQGNSPWFVDFTASWIYNEADLVHFPYTIQNS